MKRPDAQDGKVPWTRPALDRYGPNRAAGGLYRTAEVKGDRDTGGIPLVGVDDAVVAAVRLAYKVAEAQVDRSARLAERLRSAGVRALGPDVERHALDAAESLVFRTMMSGLSWLEGIAAEEKSPLKRMLGVEYRLLGSLLGLTSADDGGGQDDRRRRQPAAAPPGEANEAGPGNAASMLKVVHLGRTPRAIRVVAARLDGVAALQAQIIFYRAQQGRGSFKAQLTIRARGDAVLRVDTTPTLAPGLWRAAVCDDGGLQVGWIDVEL